MKRTKSAVDMGRSRICVYGGERCRDYAESAMINLQMADFGVTRKRKQVFYSSSACIYPAYNQEDPHKPTCKESTADPAAPDSEYGVEKLFQ